jgi:hypothetical protein
MKQITLKLTEEEIRLLAALASDQLFRREFIDPRMPGHKAVPGEVAMGKALVGRLRLLVDNGARGTAQVRTATAGYPLASPGKGPSRMPDAV